jgi:hypothetical protein
MSLDETLWRAARALATSPDGLEIVGLGTIRGGAIGPARAGSYDAPALVVRVADQLGVSDDDVRARLRAEVQQAVASAVGRPAPLGPLGLIEPDGGGWRFHPAHRGGTAAPDDIERALAAWREPADSLDQRVDALAAALATARGAFSPADQRRLLDELDYDLDDADWRAVGARIVAALPY